VLRDVAGPVAANARTTTVYVATTRARTARESAVFGPGWSGQLNFSEFTISIPPDHQPGNIEWPDGKPNPAHAFVTVSQRPLTRGQFAAKITERGGNGVGVFIHGFNVNFQEALYQTAQMSVDSDMVGIPVLFSGPSAGRVSGYIADKDAAASSRDGLAETLTMLARPGAMVHVLAHSMADG